MRRPERVPSRPQTRPTSSGQSGSGLGDELRTRSGTAWHERGGHGRGCGRHARCGCGYGCSCGCGFGPCFLWWLGLGLRLALGLRLRVGVSLGAVLEGARSAIQAEDRRRKRRETADLMPAVVVLPARVETERDDESEVELRVAERDGVLMGVVEAEGAGVF